MGQERHTWKQRAPDSNKHSLHCKLTSL